MAETSNTPADKEPKKTSGLFFGQSNILTRSKPFRLIVKTAFDDIDNEKNGEVDKNELYSGLLMVHLKLAKFAGPAACYPPSKQVCDQLFDAADTDQSGGINQQEFSAILGVLCAQIFFRMMVYYVVLILFVPYLATKVVDGLKIPNGSYLEMAAEQTISLSVFFGAIPAIWNHIDEGARQTIANSYSSSTSDSSSTPSKSEPDKKDD